MRTRLLLVTILLGVLSYGQIPTTALVKEYTFAGGTLQNTINPGTYDLVQTGTAAAFEADAIGQSNNAINLNGDTFNAGQHADPSGNFSVSFWIKTTDTAPHTFTSNGVISYSDILSQVGHSGSQSAGYAFYIHTGRVYFRGNFVINSNTFQAYNPSMDTGVIADGSWHHIAVTGTKIFSNLTLKYNYKLYLDGAEVTNADSGTRQVGSATVPTNLFAGNPDLTIGSASPYSDSMDNIREYTRALTPAEITSLAQELCVVNIPDANFKNRLVGNTAINTNGDTEIQCSEASAFTGTLHVSGANITDLTGIEAFTALTELFCFSNQLTSIDVSSNTALTRLVCFGNQLTSIDVSSNTALTYLDCNSNLLTSLDTSANTALTSLVCQYNQLTSLNVSNNTALTQLICLNNRLTNIDVSSNVALTRLDARDNQLANLNISNNVALEKLDVKNNQLTSLDVSNNTALDSFSLDGNQLTNLDVSTNTALVVLVVKNNQLTSLDVSANTALIGLDCENNQLTSLNIANSNNTNLQSFSANNNPNLTCIQVDDVNYSTSNWTNIDAQTSFSTNCNPPCIVNIPDANFKATLLNHGPNIGGTSVIDTNNDGEIQCSEANAYAGAIYVNNSSISNLTGIEAFSSITSLDCSTNQLTSIDISSNTALTHLVCRSNQITSLDISNNTSLTHLDFSNNSISSINISNHTALTELRGHSNSLTTLDTSNNTMLALLYIHGNSISALDVSANTGLTSIFCSNNQLQTLNVANSNNSNISTSNFAAINNPNLTCIQVDDVAFSTTNWTNIDSQTSFSTNCNVPCVVTIPDANFKAELVGNTAINTNGDTEIQCSEASAVTGTLDCAGLSISDLTGIEAFTALTELRCGSNQLTSLDTSSNTALERLFAFDNQLTSLNISSNTALENLQIARNRLTTLNTSNNSALEAIDCSSNPNISLNLSNNTALKSLGVSNNQFTSIDVSANINLEGFGCDNNLITNLDLSFNTKLTSLACSNNPLTAIDVSNNPDLTYFTAFNNQLTNLDISLNTKLFFLRIDNNQLTTVDVSNNPDLQEFIANDNQITSLDLSSNIVLNRIWVENNNLFSLNVANGNNSNIATALFRASNNPNLTCITVDDVNYSTTNWTNIDNQTSFSTNCPPCIVNIPDANFKAYLVGNNSINTNGDTEIQCSEASAFSGRINCSSRSISNMTGIEAFTALTELICNDNQLTALDISSNTALTTLWCQNNQITSLDVSSNINLGTLFTENNALTTLNTNGATALFNLVCHTNQLTSLDVSNNTALQFLRCYKNNLASLDVSSNSVLVTLNCAENQLTSLNVANGNNSNMTGPNRFNATVNPNLTCVNIDSGFTPPSTWTVGVDSQTSFSDNCAALGIDDFNTVDFKLYPNPVTDMVYIRSEEEIQTVRLYSILGEEIKVNNQDKSKIDVSFLSKGVYFLIIETDKGKGTQRLIKK
ncbi:leucine-rich repeat domain-containing protein [Aquimarina sp. 2201CG5-10]|uniref:leucine-rich repeat domain-containing protein n=1 Tax=Aquimarina callyspongiae TaxID=3098150 RepID=UPI002AB3D48A|nr:leucine-rich repeat domain-containing protein [Aquimarina sp. 2201CG5-10]MDY8137856.1 LamG-like jellyroll fold domain-containing protein [Aquimarina sp. 2201CG5-10]